MKNSVRTASLISGIALALMAVVAPLGLLMALPAEQLDMATTAVFVVVVLDVIVAIAIYPVLRSGGKILAAAASALRLIYAIIFAGAGFVLAGGDAERFQEMWDSGLLVFGVHLLLVGVILVRTAEMPTWIGVVVGVAGLGYMFDAAMTIIDARSVASLGEFTFIGEVVLLVWLIGWGGRGPNKMPQDLSGAEARLEIS